MQINKLDVLFKKFVVYEKAAYENTTFVLTYDLT